MAWNVDAQKLAVKVIGTVESGLKYDAVNYRDPITVGAFQWYGTRAAAILGRIRSENAASWTGVAASLVASLDAHAASDVWWTGRYLTTTEGASIKPVLFANQVIQNTQAVTDFDAYKSAYTRNGGDAEGNTDAMIFFMCMYHQAPARSLDILRSAGANASMDRLLAVALNNTVLGKYATRYNTAATMIRSHDTSGIDLGGSVGSPDTTVDEGEEAAPVGTDASALTAFTYIKRVGANLHVIGKDGHSLICPPVQSDMWQIPSDTTLGSVVPPATPISPDPVIPPGDNAGAKALAWMLANQEKWDYSQGAGRDNPDVSGYTDCSACVRLAYLKTGGPDIGGYTTPQSSYGSLITTDRETIRAGTGLLPGDLIFYKAYERAGWPFNHVEMYTGDAQKRTIGQVGSTAPGPSLHPMDRYLNWGSLGVMARRPWA